MYLPLALSTAEERFSCKIAACAVLSTKVTFQLASYYFLLSTNYFPVKFAHSYSFVDYFNCAVLELSRLREQQY